jgi:uncharacterized membrane protein
MERLVNIALWIIAGLLAVAFLAAGMTKLVKNKQALEADPRQAWAHDFSAGAIKAIGVVEVLGALGLILPAVTGIAVMLVPLAALGLAVTMAGAIIVHLRRGEKQAVVVPAVLLVMSVVVAWGRFGPYAF